MDFYPRPPRGGRPKDSVSYTSSGVFLSTPSARRATSGIFGFAVWLIISIHALREEGDDRRKSPPSPRANFYPRPPRGGRPATGDYLTLKAEISIHALREEGDTSW